MKRSSTSGLVVLAMFASACSGGDTTASQDSLVVNATGGITDDAYVSSLYPTHTDGTDTYLKVGTAGTNLHHAYLKLSVSGVPANATGIVAKLTLRSQTTSSAPINAHCGSSSSWSEATVDWSNQPGFSATTVSSVASVTAGADATFDVSACVNGNGAATVVLDQPTGTVVQFNSGESSANQPSLAVTYNTAHQIIFGMFTDTSIAPAKEGDTAQNFRAIANKFFVPAKTKVHRVFNSSLPSSYAASAGADDPSQGNVSFLSVKPPGGDFKGVAAGKYDATIQSLAKTIPSGSYFTMYHEPEDNMSGADFVAMFKQFYKVAKGANPNITIGYVAMTYQWRSGSASTANEDAWYPGDASTDFLGADAYDASWMGAHSLDTQADFQRWYQWAAKHNKPLLLAEYGVEDVSTGGFSDSVRASIIQGTMSWLASQSQIKMVLYWDGTEGTPGGKNHILNPTPSHPTDTYQQARAAWVAGINQYGTTATTF